MKARQVVLFLSACPVSIRSGRIALWYLHEPLDHFPNVSFKRFAVPLKRLCKGRFGRPTYPAFSYLVPRIACTMQAANQQIDATSGIEITIEVSYLTHCIRWQHVQIREAKDHFYPFSFFDVQRYASGLKGKYSETKCIVRSTVHDHCSGSLFTKHHLDC